LSAAQKGTGLISRAVREALSTLVSPQMCEQLIERSLASYGLDTIPENGHQVGSWLEDSLRPAVELAVGPDAADLMMAQLGPIAAYAAISNPKLAPLAPAPVPASARPISSLPPVPDFDDAEDEGNRPTGLRFDTGAEPNWEAEPDRSAVKLAPSRSHDSGPPTGLFQNARELTFSPLPPANANVRLASPADGVVTLPPVRTLNDSDRPTSLPPQGELRVASDRPTSMPPPYGGRSNVVSDATENLPQVLTATNDQKDLAALRRYLSGTAKVTHIADFVGLLDALEAPNLVEPIVLVDCQRPSVHISSIASIGEDLPRGTTVVLWGADDNMWQQIDRDRSPSCRWVRCSREATTDDVGSLCSMLLG
jgi:hypothetical protein